jgi:hypothetical protein
MSVLDSVDQPREESVLHATTVAVDLAKEIFERTFADAEAHGPITTHFRLSRTAASKQAI